MKLPKKLLDKFTELEPLKKRKRKRRVKKNSSSDCNNRKNKISYMDKLCIKIGYETESIAFQKANAYSLLGSADQSPYLCEKCNFWHLTTIN